MPNRYVIQINEDTLDLIQFLNDGIRPLIEEKPTSFVCEIPEPHTITARIVDEEETLMLSVYLKGDTLFLK